jgi:predicted phosphodiesterase
MLIAFLSDIHANLPALRSALAAAGERGAERIVVCGDIVGDGPFPAETVELLRSQRSLAAIR